MHFRLPPDGLKPWQNVAPRARKAPHHQAMSHERGDPPECLARPRQTTRCFAEVILCSTPVACIHSHPANVKCRGITMASKSGQRSNIMFAGLHTDIFAGDLAAKRVHPSSHL